MWAIVAESAFWKKNTRQLTGNKRRKILPTIVESFEWRRRQTLSEVEEKGGAGWGVYVFSTFSFNSTQVWKTIWITNSNN